MDKYSTAFLSASVSGRGYFCIKTPETHIYFKNGMQNNNNKKIEWGAKFT